jgi:hypothetical protein
LNKLEYEVIIAGNQVARLDADETEFLDFCTERQQEIIQERKQEEENIISEMKISFIYLKFDI